MTYQRFEPFRGFETIFKTIDDVAKEFSKEVDMEKSNKFSPRVDIVEDEANVYLLAELPGMNKDEVKISINEEGVLTMTGTKKVTEETKQTYFRRERRYGDFRRCFKLPENLDYDAIKANFERGLLTLTVPKRLPEAPKEYEVNID